MNRKKIVLMQSLLLCAAFASGAVSALILTKPTQGNEYRTGWEDAVRECAEGKLIIGPLTITGDQTRFEGMTIKVVNILKAGPTVLVTNAPGARISIKVDTAPVPAIVQ